MSSQIKTFFDNQYSLLNFCIEKKELTFAQDVEQLLRKNLPLAVASYFEHEIVEMIISYTRTKSHNCEELTNFVSNKAIKRQYHTFFDWEKGSNINSFLGLFGDDFKTQVSNEIKANPTLTAGSRAFLEIGSIRNRIVHQNYAAFISDKSAEEIFNLYLSAETFVNYLREKFSP